MKPADIIQSLLEANRFSARDLIGMASNARRIISVTSYTDSDGDDAQEPDFDEEGVAIDPTEDWNPDEDPPSVAEAAAKYISGNYAHNPSSMPWSPGTWYSTDSEMDYRTGVQVQTSYFLRGFTEEEEAEIYRLVTGK